MSAGAMAWYGTAEPPLPRHALRAGDLTAVLEEGALRTIRWRGVEVVRGIGFVVRDTGWGTLAPQITGLVTTETLDGFIVRYAATCGGPDGTFAYRASIEGDARGRLHFAAEGTPIGGAVATNRVGFVVLHAIAGVAGSPLVVTHGDGTTTRTRFPSLIAPHQPASDIAGLSHVTPAGVGVVLRFEGDTFEMEDQRNWGDASFKTYCRPLAKGFPYSIPAGAMIRQAVDLHITGTPAPAVRQEASSGSFRMPGIALAMDATDATDALAVAAAVREIGVSRILVRIDPRAVDITAASIDIAACAVALGTAVTLELVCPGVDPVSELAAFAMPLAASGLLFDEVMPIPLRDFSSRPTGTPAGQANARAIADAARLVFPGRRIVGGGPGSFTEFNRNPPAAEFVDSVQSAFCAIVHAADDHSVIETLESLGDIGASMAALAPGAARRIATATIAMRDSMDAPAPLPNPSRRRVPRAERDPRHFAAFGAAWAVAFAMRAGAAGIDLVAPATITGRLGLFDRDGGRLPLFHAVHALAAWSGMAVTRLSPDAGRHTVSAAGRTLIANLGPDQNGSLAPFAILDTSSSP